MVTLFRFVFSKFIDLVPSSWFIVRNKIAKLMKIKLGKNVRINIGFRVYGPGKVVIGDNVWIGPNCRIYTAGSDSRGGVYIGNNCDIAPEVVFVCGSHEIGDTKRRAGKGISHDIVVENGVWIGCRSIIFAENIGNASIIGAGSVVLKNIGQNQLVAGCPAIFKKELDK
jgi:maltose O-acetyltransferase